VRNRAAAVRGNSARAVLLAILHTAPMAPATFNQELPARLQQVISDCLEKIRTCATRMREPSRRPESASRRDLESGRTASVIRTGDALIAVEPTRRETNDQVTISHERIPAANNCRHRSGCGDAAGDTFAADITK
jgi:hypothetical protein